MSSINRLVYSVNQLVSHQMLLMLLFRFIQETYEDVDERKTRFGRQVDTVRFDNAQGTRTLHRFKKLKQYQTPFHRVYELPPI